MRGRESDAERQKRFAKVEAGVIAAFKAAVHHLGEDAARELFNRVLRRPKRGRGKVLAADRDEPIGVALALPFIVVVKGIEAAWDGLETNITDTMLNLGSFLTKAWAQVGAGIENIGPGRAPFRASTVMETLVLVMEGEPVPPRRLTPATRQVD